MTTAVACSIGFDSSVGFSGITTATACSVVGGLIGEGMTALEGFGNGFGNSGGSTESKRSHEGRYGSKGNKGSC